MPYPRTPSASAPRHPISRQPLISAASAAPFHHIPSSQCRGILTSPTTGNLHNPPLPPFPLIRPPPAPPPYASPMRVHTCDRRSPPAAVASRGRWPRRRSSQRIDYVPLCSTTYPSLATEPGAAEENVIIATQAGCAEHGQTRTQPWTQPSRQPLPWRPASSEAVARSTRAPSAQRDPGLSRAGVALVGAPRQAGARTPRRQIWGAARPSDLGGRRWCADSVVPRDRPAE